MRSYSDAESGSSEVRVSFIPVFAFGDFSFSFNIDSKQLDPAFIKEDRGLPFWLSYGFSFVDSFKWKSRSGLSAVAFDRTTYLHGDRSGLFPGLNHYWDGMHERLSFDGVFEIGPYTQRLFFSDLSFSDWAEPDASFLSGLLFDLSFDHISFGAGLLSDIGYGESATTMLLPELWLSVPLWDRIGLSVDFGAVMGIDDIRNAQPSDLENYGVFLELPVKTDRLELTIGSMWQSGSIWFARWNEYYKPIETGSESVALYFTGLYGDQNVDLKLDFLMNMDPYEPKLIADNSFLDFSVGFSMGAIDTIVGIRKQNIFSLKDFFDMSDIYFGMETTSGSLTSRFIFRFTEGQPQLGFTSSLALVDIDNVGRPETKESIVTLKFDLGFRSIHDEDIEFLVHPILSMGREDMMVSFRVPFNIQMGNRKVSLAPLKGDEWWTLWKDTSSVEAIYDSVTDMFAFIDALDVKTEDGIFTMELSRTEPMNDVFFENYRSADALSLDMGFTFQNLAFGLWVDDMEAPRILNPKLVWYPVDNDSAAFTVSAPTEILIKDLTNCEITSFFGLSFMYPFLNNRLEVSAFAYGELYALYEDGRPVSTRIIYDFKNKEFGSYMIGGEISWTDRHWHVGFAGGINRGLLYPNYWNSFTSLNPDRDKSKEVVGDFSIWMIGEAGLYFDSVQFFTKYVLPDMAALWTEDRVSDGDMLTFALRFTLPNGVGLSMNLSRLDVISTINEIKDLNSYLLSEKTIYGFSLIKEFGKMSLEAELSAQAFYGRSKEGYVNSYSLIKVAPGARIKTRIGF